MPMVRLLVVSKAIKHESVERYAAKLKKQGMTLVSSADTSMGLPNKDLTRRQTQVAARLAMGFSTHEIANDLKIGEKTVETHRQQLMKRLGISRIPELVRYALQRGVVPAAWLLS